MALTAAQCPRQLDADTAVVVIDVVRAMTSLLAALAAGAAGVLTVGTVEEARGQAGRRAAAGGRPLLCGERGGLPPEGFELGNSPREFDEARCRDRLVVMTTTNGTAAVEGAAGAGHVLAAGLANAEATARALAARRPGRILLLCAGSGGEVAADDVAAAGCIAGSLILLGAGDPADSALPAIALFDAWRADLGALLRVSVSGRKLAHVGLLRDLDDCAQVDVRPLVAARGADGVFRCERDP